MVTNPNDKGQPRNPSEASRKSGLDALSDDDRAGAGMEIGRMLNEIDEQDESDPEPNDVDLHKDVPPEDSSTGIPNIRSVHESLAWYERSERRTNHRLYLMIVLVLLGGAAVAGALLFNRLVVGETTPTSGGVAAPAAQAPAAGPDAPPVSGECAVSPASLTVASTDIRSDQGVNDPAMFVVQWTPGVTNNSNETILVRAKIASSDNGGSGAWDATTYGPLAPGETYLWPTRSQVTNNAGGVAGPTTWRYVDQILAVRDSPECGALLVSPTDETAKAAIPAEVPPMPANAQLPAR